MESIKKNFKYNIIYNVITAVSPLITAPYIARVLGAYNIGVHSYITSVASYFVMVAALGIASFGQREVAINRDDRIRLSSVFLHIEVISALSTLLVASLWFVFSYIDKEFSILYRIMTIQIIAVAFDISWFYSGIEKFYLILRKNIASQLSYIVLLFCFVKEPKDLNKYCFIVVITAFCGNILYWANLKKYIHIDKKLTLKTLWKNYKALWLYFVPSIATQVYTVLDRIMLKILVGDYYSNGYYDQAVKVCNIPLMLVLSLDTVMASRMSYLFKTGNEKEMERRLKQSLGFSIGVGLPLFCGLILISNRFIPWFLGNDYIPAVQLIYFYAPIILCIAINNCLSTQYLTPIGRRKYTAIIVTISAFINVLLNFLLIPIYNATGAAIASVISEAFIAIVYMILCKKVISLFDYIKICWRYVVAALLMLIILKVFWNNDIVNIWYIVSEIIIGAIIYLVCLYGLKDELLQEIIKLIKGK